MLGTSAMNAVTAVRNLAKPRTFSAALANDIQRRSYAIYPLYGSMPGAPPREYNADGTPKKYRLNQYTYDHPYEWERWTLSAAGVFHTVYVGEFAKDMPWYWAYLGQFPAWIGLVPVMTTIVLISIIAQHGGSVGIKPKRYTVEWVEASKERDRAENSNPVTNYLDRRRKERGSNWLLQDYLPHHGYWPYMGHNHHDTEYLRELAAKKAEKGEEDDK